MQIEHIMERLYSKKYSFPKRKFQSFKCIVDHAGSITEVGSSNPLAVTWPPSIPVIVVNRSWVQLSIITVTVIQSGSTKLIFCSTAQTDKKIPIQL